MKKQLLTLGLCLLSATALHAGDIKDVPKSDPAYPSVEKAVDSGYLSLFKDDMFLPNRAISRKEFAIILDRVLKQESTNWNLSTTERQDLSTLAKNFKEYFATTDTNSLKSFERISKIEDEQKVINYDMSKLTEENASLKEENKFQQTLLWIALGLGGLGILL